MSPFLTMMKPGPPGMQVAVGVVFGPRQEVLSGKHTCGGMTSVSPVTYEVFSLVIFHRCKKIKDVTYNIIRIG